MSVNAIWMCESEQSFWFEKKKPEFLAPDVKVTKMIPEDRDEIQIDEWNGLTDKHKVVLIRHAPNWTTLQLIEEVETMLKGLNK